ncbi:hypothetical protein EIN_065150 [Entamoeba invadens IP1]|uniref:CNH domain-containing protein n=1 Tax=Entamoeba invadens IP1 TaxID=370355 RepID=A0A0A1TXK9_ENTIV|nr:hypothetical protein EIN_065150 [Entamoeba invadens IP1]ELP84260.1 hypothetical protein EIN_065150 [Entamoeba invadens IP1]|eukprot:XP_004183606.1 hypothetical protein EIN_065150 [Entamoeba invadens IP1]
MNKPVFTTKILLETSPSPIRSLAFGSNKMYIGGEDGSIYKAEYVDNKYMIMRGVRVSKQPITMIQVFPKSEILLFVTCLKLGVLTSELERITPKGEEVIGEDCAVILRDKDVIKSHVEHFGIYSTQRLLTFMEYTKDEGFQIRVRGILFETIPQTIEWTGNRIYYIQGDLIKFVRLSDRKVGVLRERRGQGKMRPFVRAIGEFLVIGNSESLQVVNKKGIPVENVKEVFPAVLNTLANIVIHFPFVVCVYTDCIRVYNFINGKLENTFRVKSDAMCQDEKNSKIFVSKKQSTGPIVLLTPCDLIQYIKVYIESGEYIVISQLLEFYTNEMQTTLQVISDQELLLVRIVYGGLLIEKGVYGEAFQQFLRCVQITKEAKLNWDVRSVLLIFGELNFKSGNKELKPPVDWNVVEQKMVPSEVKTRRKEVFGKLSEFLQNYQKLEKYEKDIETQRIKALILSERDDVVEEIELDERRGWYIDVDEVLFFEEERNELRVKSKLYVMKKNYIKALSIWNELAMVDDERVYEYGIDDVLLIIQVLDCNSNVEMRLMKIALGWVVPDVFDESGYLDVEVPPIREKRNKMLEERAIKEQLIDILTRKMKEKKHHDILHCINMLHAKLSVLINTRKNKEECVECTSELINGCIEVINENKYRKEYKEELSHVLQDVLSNSVSINLKSIVPSLQKYQMQKELIVVYEKLNQIKELICELMIMGGVDAVLQYCKSHPKHSTVLFDYAVSEKREILKVVIMSLIDNLDIFHVLEKCIEHNIEKEEYITVLLKRIRSVANTYMALNFQFNLLLADSSKESKKCFLVDKSSKCFLCQAKLFTNFVEYEGRGFCFNCYKKLNVRQPFVFE